MLVGTIGAETLTLACCNDFVAVLRDAAGRGPAALARSPVLRSLLNQLMLRIVQVSAASMPAGQPLQQHKGACRHAGASAPRAAMLPTLYLGSAGVQEEEVYQISSHLARLPNQLRVGLVAEGMLEQAFALLQPASQAGNELQVRLMAQCCGGDVGT